MKDLIIVGGGASGQEMHAWASPHFASMGFTFKGFLDDNPAIGFNSISDYRPMENDVFICSIGSTAARVKCSRQLRESGAVFVNIIHPSAIVLSPINSTGVVIAPFVFVSNDVCLNDDVFINASATIGHNAIIGEGCVICAHVDVTGYAVIGEQVFIGSHACIIPGKIVGDAAIIGAGSAVMRNVPGGVTMIGVPAKRLF
ncbi:hypothetical protein E3226_006085 [Legionella geestiana]|uniref:DapH/DapD/GlmU-related protein n=1 Tax=Legionella geestiana TaxID=45065 RepID=UPI001092FA63|nr:DapH/DapD/GlmU-related protein [Legionella geestiana]QDQ39995.1 hypothetical protein E3226_006085 [Legionella geestiana]